MNNTGINNVTASEGGLVFSINCPKEGGIKRRADDVQDGVYWIEQYGLADDVAYDIDSCACEMMFAIMVEANKIQLV